MVRTFAWAVVALFLATSSLTHAADGEKKPAAKPVSGKIKAVDAEKGTLTVTVGGGEGGAAKDIEFKIAGAKLLSGKNEVKASDLKVGDIVSVVSADGKTATQVTVGAVKKGEKK